MKRNLSESGFTLISAMVAAGVMIVVGLGFATLMTNMTRQAQLVGTRFDKTILAQDLRTLMAESSTCTRVFGGGTQAMSSTANSKTELTANIAPPGQEPVLVKQGEDLRRYNVKVRKFYVENPVSAGTGMAGTRLFIANVVLELDELSADTNAWSFRASQIGSAYFEMPVGSDVIQRCYTLETQSDMLESACAKFGGVFNAATRQCDTLANDCGRLGGVWNASTRTCKVGQTPQESCSSLGGTFSNGGCRMMSKTCPGSETTTWNGLKYFNPNSGESQSGTIQPPPAGGDSCSSSVCVDGVWVPMYKPCPNEDDGGGQNMQD